MSETMKPHVENRDVSYEKRDVNARAILWVGVAIIISAVVIHFAVWGVFDFFSAREAHKGKPPATLVNTKRQQPPQRPRLQTDAPADLQELRARETAALESYGWVDRQKGIVHIPVERAMELLVERGLPTTEPTMTSPAESQTSAGKNMKTTVGAGQGKSQKQ
jgi:hypothetical protein